MRAIKYIVVHTTATPQTAKISSIQNYWKTQLGWKSPGYHKIIEPNGKVVTLSADSAPTNGVAGYNSNSLHVSYIGGVDAKGKPVDNRTEAQKLALLKVVAEWKEKYPGAIVQGHRDFLTPGKPGWKDCPCFDVKSWVKCLGI